MRPLQGGSLGADPWVGRRVHGDEESSGQAAAVGRGPALTVKPGESIGCSLSCTAPCEITGSLGRCRKKGGQALMTWSSGPYLVAGQADLTSRLPPASTAMASSSARQAA